MQYGGKAVRSLSKLILKHEDSFPPLYGPPSNHFLTPQMSKAHLGADPGERGALVGEELVEGRVEEADGDGKSLHHPYQRGGGQKGRVILNHQYYGVPL